MNAKPLLLIAFLAILGSAFAQEASLPDFSVPEGMVQRDFELGQADMSVIEDFMKQTLTENGKFYVFPATRVMRVTDKPEVIETIRKTLPHLTAPAPNVKIEFTARGVSSDTRRGVQGRGFIDQRGGAIEIDVLNQRRSGDSLTKQFIVARSGSEGFIEVSRDIPMIDFFTRFVADGGYGAVFSTRPQIFRNPNVLVLANGYFEVPQIRWEKAGARLLVRPTVQGNLITLEIMPQISAVTIIPEAVLRARDFGGYLTGREQYVTYTDLSTTVTVQNGQSVPIGGFTEASPEFNRYFYGGSKGGSFSSSQFTVTATIIDPAGRPTSRPGPRRQP